jgi:hypothetical protein
MSQYIPDMLGWLKDLNWPGALIILRRLKLLPEAIIKKTLENAVYNAIKTKDYEWLYFLTSYFVRNANRRNAMEVIELTHIIYIR